MAIPEPPNALQAAEWLWDAWVALQTCRPMVGGMGMMSLPLRWHDVQAYADWLVLGGDSGRVLHSVIRALDRVHLAHEAREAKTRERRDKV